MDGDADEVTGFAAGLEAPSGDAAKEVEAVGLEAADADLNLVRERSGVTVSWTTLEDDDVPAVGGFSGRDDVEGNAGKIHGSGFGKVEGLVGGLLGLIDAACGGGGEGVPEVERAVFSAVNVLHVGDDVAERVTAEPFEAFRHERTTGVDAGLDVGGLDLLDAGEAFQGDGGGVLSGDDAGVGLAVLGFDVPLDEGRIHFGVGIDDGGKELADAVGTHAC